MQFDFINYVVLLINNLIEKNVSLIIHKHKKEFYSSIYINTDKYNNYSSYYFFEVRFFVKSKTLSYL